jgi:hypothetical protein
MPHDKWTAADLADMSGRHRSSPVVTGSSEMHKKGQVDPADLNGTRRVYQPFQAYCDTSLTGVG